MNNTSKIESESLHKFLGFLKQLETVSLVKEDIGYVKSDATRQVEKPRKTCVVVPFPPMNLSANHDEVP